MSSGRSISIKVPVAAGTSAADASRARPPRSPRTFESAANRERANNAGAIATPSRLEATTGASSAWKRASNASRCEVVTNGISARHNSTACACPFLAAPMPSRSDTDRPAARSGFATISNPRAARRAVRLPPSSGQTAIRRPGFKSTMAFAACRASGVPRSGVKSLSLFPNRLDCPAASRMTVTRSRSIIRHVSVPTYLSHCPVK